MFFLRVYMKRRKFLSSITLVAGLASSGWVISALATPLPPDAFFGHEFPDVDGKKTKLTGYLGKPLVLNFWATWCPPCVKEMPDLDILHHKYPGINIVGLAADTVSNVIKFGDKVSVSYPLLVAGHAGISMMRDLGNKKGGLPFTVIFDAQGRIQHRILGQINLNDLDAILATMS